MSENEEEILEVPGEVDEGQEGQPPKPTERKGGSRLGSRRSVAYDYFTQNQVTKKWKCNLCK
jgi:hypothetical protein